MNNPEKPILDVGSLDVLTELEKEIFRNLRCVMVGEIQSFDKSKKTAEIEIKFKRVFPDGSSASYPQLVDCPVFTLQGGGAAVQLPIEQGDPCLVLFSDRSLDNWFKTGDAQAPADDRAHNISDGIALVGINALGSDLPDYQEGTARMIYGTSQLLLKSDRSRLISGNAEVLIQNNLITLKNTTTSLLTLVNGLIDLISNLTTAGSPAAHTVDAASKALLTAYKLQIAQLLGQ